MTLAKTFELAAAEIEKRGWCRESIEDESGAVCAWGAVKAVLGGSPRCTTSLDALNAERYWEESTGRIMVVWNDAAGRSAEQVTAKLRELSIRAKEEGL
jgi:hypothetical protein